MVENKGNSTVLGSIRWSIIGQALSRVMMIGVSIVLARLLAPEDSGLMAMAMVIIGFMETFYELGTGSAIIQKKEISQELLSSLFYINIFFGIFLAVLFGSSGHFVAELYQDDRVAPILQVMGLVFFISSFGLVHHALMRRNLNFDRLTIIETITLVIDSVVAIVLAVMGWSVWALVYSLLANRLALTVLLFVSEKWRPGFQFSITEVKTVLSFTLNLTGSKIFNYFSRNSDKFIIGRFLGAASLGYYSLAFKLITYPIEFVQTALGRVLFPALARLEDNKSFRIMYLRACGAIALLVFPIMVGMGTLADPFINVVYDSKWEPSVIILIIMSPVGIVQSILSTVIHIYLVKGRTDQYFAWAFTSGAVIAVSFVCGLPWGLLGVTIAFSSAIMLLGALGFWMPFRLIELKMRDFLKVLSPYFLMSVAMAAAIFVCNYWLKSIGASQFWQLFAGTATGFLSYSILCLLAKPAALADLIRLMPTVVQKNPLFKSITDANIRSDVAVSANGKKNGDNLISIDETHPKKEFQNGVR